MEMLKDFARSGISYGIALAAYDLFYVPMHKGWGIEPQSAMAVGLEVLICATVLYCIAEWRRTRTEKRLSGDQ